MKNTLGANTYSTGDLSSISAVSTTLSTGLKNYTFASPLFIEKGYMPNLDYSGGQTCKIAVDTSGTSSYSDYSYLIGSNSYTNEKLNSSSKYRFHLRLFVGESTSM